MIGYVQGSYAHGKPTKVMVFYFSSKGLQLKKNSLSSNLANYIINSLVVFLDKKSLNFKK